MLGSEMRRKIQQKYKREKGKTQQTFLNFKHLSPKKLKQIEHISLVN